MGKEAFNQTINIQNSDYSGKWDQIGIFDMFDDGENLWFTAIEYNALFKMNKRTSGVEYMGSFPEEESYGYRLYASINEWNGKLFFAPCTAHEIGVYDINNKCFEKINIGISKENNDLSNIKYAKKFVSSFIYNNMLFLIPCCYTCIVIYNISTQKISFQYQLFEHFYTKYKDCTTSLDSHFYLCWFAKRLNPSEIVFNLHSNRNILAFYNFETGKFREQIIGKEQDTFSLIECNDGHIYLYETSRDTLVKWDIESGNYSECSISDKLTTFQPCGLNYSFGNMTVFGNWLYLVPTNTNMAVRINTSTLNVEEIDALSGECAIQQKGVAYLNLCKVFDNKLYLYGNRSKEVIVYEENGELQRNRIKVPENTGNIIVENHLVDMVRNHCCLVNEGHISLPQFINVLVNIEKEYKI